MTPIFGDSSAPSFYHSPAQRPQTPGSAVGHSRCHLELVLPGSGRANRERASVAQLKANARTFVWEPSNRQIVSLPRQDFGSQANWAVSVAMPKRPLFLVRTRRRIKSEGELDE